MRLPRPSHLADNHRLRPALALPLLAACVVLTACGSSSSNSTSTTNTSTGTAAAPPQGAGPGRFAALRSCLQKQGITLPPRSRSRRPGAPGALGGLPGGGGLQLPKGVTQTQFQEALKTCGAGNFPGGRRLSGATAKAALTKFAACMRENGVNLPPPSTSGNGPIFNTGGINTRGATFKAAEGKCRSDLQGAFGRRGGPPNGAPPSGGGGAPAGEAGGG